MPPGPPGGPRTLQEASGRHRRPQEAIGNAKRPRKATGGPERPQEQEASECNRNGSTPMCFTFAPIYWASPGARILDVIR
eukprot:2203122-Pyramimonas_sp.AAC.1